jgi:hypothetical protein
MRYARAPISASTRPQAQQQPHNRARAERFGGRFGPAAAGATVFFTLGAMPQAGR